MDESENLHWHALNYRTAAPQHAEEMWQELVACVERKVAAERDRCAMKLQVTRAEVQLAAGELSTEEWRMCAAVLRWMQGRIRGPNVRAKPGAVGDSA